MLNLVSLSTQSLASCVNYFVWNCLTCFSNTKIGSVTSFSILFNFQGPVAPQPSGWQLIYFTTEAVFCQALFFRGFWTFWTWIILNISVSAGIFERLLVLFKGFVLRLRKSFFCLSAWRSSIIPHLPPSVNTFRQVFSCLFCNPFRRAEIDTIWMPSASRWASSEAASFIFAACPERSFHPLGRDDRQPLRAGTRFSYIM